MIKEFSRGSAFAALMLLTPAVHAQETTLPAVNPGRPTVTDVALLTVPGYLEMESGLNYVRGKTGSDDQSSQAILLKLTDRPGRTQLRLSTNGYVVQRAWGTTVRGLSDTVIGVQHLFAVQRLFSVQDHSSYQDRSSYDVSGRIEYKLPTGGMKLGTGKADLNLLLLASKDYSELLHADFNLGQASVGRSSRNVNAGQTFASAALSYRLPQNFTVQTELYGFAGNSSNGTNVVNGYGFTYTPRPDHVIDGYVGFGLTHAAPKFTVTIGHTFFLGKLF